MTCLTDLPDYVAPSGSRLILLEAGQGPARSLYLQRWLEGAKTQEAETWLLACDFEFGGVWAGLRELVRGIAEKAEIEAPEVIERHASELALILPTLRRRLNVHRSLTDLAASGEKVRN